MAGIVTGKIFLYICHRTNCTPPPMAYRTILLIDDDKDDQEIFLSALEQVTASVSVHTISNAHEALDSLLTGQLQPDLIFLDLNMPVMNGLEFLAEIKKGILSHIPVAILSTSAHRPTMEAVSRLGAHRFITKPDRFDELISILRSILG